MRLRCREGDSNREAAGLRGFAEGGRSGGGVRGARPDRLGALAAPEKAVAAEAVAVAGEEVGHLFLPRVDEAHPLVIGHAAHLEKQADVLPRLVVDAEELEDPAPGGRTVRVLLEVAHAKMLARAPARLNARAAGPRGRRSRLLVRALLRRTAINSAAGSPKRALYSRTRGHFLVSINPT